MQIEDLYAKCVPLLLVIIPQSTVLLLTLNICYPINPLRTLLWLRYKSSGLLNAALYFAHSLSVFIPLSFSLEYIGTLLIA